MRPRGSVIRRGRRYSVVIDRGTNPITGKRLRDWHSGFETRRDAERAKTKLLHALDTGSYVDPLSQTIGDYLVEEWLPSRKPSQRRTARGHRGQVSPTTYSYLRDQVTAYVLPHIGDVTLQRLTAEVLESLYDELETTGGRKQQGLSAKTVLNLHRTIHKALGDAVRRGKVVTNVADVVDPPRAAQAGYSVWTVDQLRTFLHHVRHDAIYAAWLLFVTTGMRRGEVAGLAGEDMDLNEGRLRVQWTLGIVDGKPTWKPRPKS